MLLNFLPDFFGKGHGRFYPLLDIWWFVISWIQKIYQKEEL